MIAVCEIYGMTKDSMFRAPAQKAVDYAARIQAEEGGWRYRPGVDSDTSVNAESGVISLTASQRND